MGAQRAQYQIVGRYMSGKDVTGYHLANLSTGKSQKYTREQVAYLVGRGSITNAEGQIYKDQFLLRSTGTPSIDNLPVQNEDGKVTRTDAVGHIRRGDSAEDIMNKLKITGVVADGRVATGYIISNAGGGKKVVTREELIGLAKGGRIGNARVQSWQGKLILKGVDCNLNELPKIKPSEVASL